MKFGKVLGLAALAGGGFAAYKATSKMKELKATYDQVIAFSGEEKEYDEFDGASIAVMFAGLEVDLTNAVMVGETATLKLYGEYCGIDVKVPSEWNVKVEGIDEKAGVDNSVVYDGQDRLIQWTRGTSIRNFHYDEHNRLLFETNAVNAITAMWLYRGNQVVAMADSNGTYFYHTDLNGNVSFLSDASGGVAAAYSYLPFGLQTVPVDTIHNPFTFVGSFGVLDLGEGLYYMQSRTYDARTHAFPGL